jgi:hypothetical protein
MKDYQEEIDELVPGQTIRLNHINCSAGADTRRRLYLTRTHADETKVLGYCHNCQESGVYTDTGWEGFRDHKHIGIIPCSSSYDIIAEPDGLLQSEYWPGVAHNWRIKVGLDGDQCNKYGIKYDPSSDRLYLPRYKAGKLIGYQLKALHTWQRPKYYTVTDQSTPQWTQIGLIQYTVLVEDLASGIRIAELADINDGVTPGAIVNYGTQVDPVLMHLIASTCATCIVWLDNDNLHVRNQAKQMERTIKMYSDKIKVFREPQLSDPKHHNDTQILQRLEEIQRGFN